MADLLHPTRLLPKDNTDGGTELTYLPRHWQGTPPTHRLGGRGTFDPPLPTSDCKLSIGEALLAISGLCLSGAFAVLLWGPVMAAALRWIGGTR